MVDVVIDGEFFELDREVGEELLWLGSFLRGDADVGVELKPLDVDLIGVCGL